MRLVLLSLLEGRECDAPWFCFLPFKGRIEVGMGLL